MSDSSVQRGTEGAAPRAPRPAATVVLVRDAQTRPGGIEVLLLERADVKDHNSRAWVFPGGVMEPEDAALQEFCRETDDGTASARLGLESGGLGYFVAAIRECFEETGLLLGAPTPPAGQCAQWRAGLRSGEVRFKTLCREQRLTLAVEELAYISHWITPRGLPKRYDTRFFLAAAPRDQAVEVDGIELVAHRWLPPADALARGGEWKLMNATRGLLELLRPFDRLESLFGWARGLGQIPVVEPRFAHGSAGRRSVPPSDPAWEEVGRLDPEGTGSACYELQPGQAVALSPRLQRVTVAVGGSGTAGANSYLVYHGDGRECVVVDPWSTDPRHLELLLGACRGAIHSIVLTAETPENSAAAHLLAQRSGACVGLEADPEPNTDDADAPARLRRLQLSEIGPGHAVYVLEVEQTLLCGTALEPADVLCERLQHLAAEGYEWLAPARGFLQSVGSRVRPESPMAKQ